MKSVSQRLGLETPWRLANEIRRLLILPMVRVDFALAGIDWGTGWKIHGRPILQIHRHSTITIGSYLQLRSSSRSNPLSPQQPVVISTRTARAVLTIGDFFGMTGGSLVVDEQIQIGNNVAVGANTIICDTDFHPLQPSERQKDPNRGTTAPIVIEDNVFIGMQSLILKGVTIGTGSVIGAGSVVTRDVPPGVVVAGNPAKIIKRLDELDPNFVLSGSKPNTDVAV